MRNDWESCLIDGAQVSPSGRYQRTCAVGQYQNQMKGSTAVRPPQHLERLSFERMGMSGDRHPVRITVEMAVVAGSVSCGPSTASIRKS